ncbi:hypothetical protein [Legionella maioricensis]|uniref:Uncharacterized protein n=1 Tax=Legionella maioricensis TaxID=2896528 RepID=A0A9X2D279_9GAMM|nr:hypothetical protein [Legionella maioricensis]MCL9685121.1 hypothetical protein [Legionella maioricensis]MCL9688366.1 hypothetical protein [Legionella maioricensis]
MYFVRARTLFLIALFLFPTLNFAGIPPITLTLQNGATTTLANGEMGAANYLVSLNPRVPGSLNLTLAGGIPAGVGQITSQPSACSTASPVCTSLFRLSPGGSCCLMLQLNGSNMTKGINSIAPIVGTTPLPSTYSTQAAPLAVSVTAAPAASTLSVSVSNLALSVNNLSLNAQLTGSPRVIIISNVGSQTVTGLSVNFPTWPAGTTATDNCGNTLAPGNSCTITITPGANPTTNCNTGLVPSPGVVTVSATNAASVQTNVVVLSYGCIYQGGFIYSVDDTTPNTDSILGKIAAVTDTVPGTTAPAAGLPDWGGDGTDVSPGGSTYENNPVGANNGSVNTATIISVLGCSLPNAACSCNALSVNAAGTSSCSSPSLCYTGWYLPAICELGPFGIACTAGSTNIQEQLFVANPPIPGLGLVDTGYYFSSTEYSGTPTHYAWYEVFFTPGGGGQAFDGPKDFSLGARCSRALTP